MLYGGRRETSGPKTSTIRQEPFLRWQSYDRHDHYQRLADGATRARYSIVRYDDYPHRITRNRAARHIGTCDRHETVCLIAALDFRTVAFAGRVTRNLNGKKVELWSSIGTSIFFSAL